MEFSRHFCGRFYFHHPSAYGEILVTHRRLPLLLGSFNYELFSVLESGPDEPVLWLAWVF